VGADGEQVSGLGRWRCVMSSETRYGRCSLRGRRIGRGRAFGGRVCAGGNTRRSYRATDPSSEVAIGNRASIAARRGETPTGRSGPRAAWVSNPPSAREDARDWSRESRVFHSITPLSYVPKRPSAPERSLASSYRNTFEYRQESPLRPLSGAPTDTHIMLFLTKCGYRSKVKVDATQAKRQGNHHEPHLD